MAELNRLKLELTALQKTNNDQADRIVRQNKENTALEARLRDLRKSTAANQLHAAEAIRKEEVKEREKKIGEVERELIREQRRRETIESQLEEIKKVVSDVTMEYAHLASASIPSS